MHPNNSILQCLRIYIFETSQELIIPQILPVCDKRKKLYLHMVESTKSCPHLQKRHVSECSQGKVGFYNTLESLDLHELSFELYSMILTQVHSSPLYNMIMCYLDLDLVNFNRLSQNIFLVDIDLVIM